MAKVEFELQDDLVPLTGFAVFQCAGPDGEPVVGESEFGDMKPVEIIGLLTVALDQYRYDFVDKSGRPEDED